MVAHTSTGQRKILVTRADKILGIAVALFICGSAFETFDLKPVGGAISLVGISFFFWWLFGDHD